MRFEKWQALGNDYVIVEGEGLEPSLTPARVRLRPTMQSDLDYVLSLEQDPANLPFITPWERTQHEAAIRFPDFRHFIIEAGSGLDAAGFVKRVAPLLAAAAVRRGRP